MQRAVCLSNVPRACGKARPRGSRRPLGAAGSVFPGSWDRASRAHRGQPPGTSRFQATSFGPRPASPGPIPRHLFIQIPSGLSCDGRSPPLELRTQKEPAPPAVMRILPAAAGPAPSPCQAGPIRRTSRPPPALWQSMVLPDLIDRAAAPGPGGPRQAPSVGPRAHPHHTGMGPGLGAGPPRAQDRISGRREEEEEEDGKQEKSHGEARTMGAQQCEDGLDSGDQEPSSLVALGAGRQGPLRNRDEDPSVLRRVARLEQALKEQPAEARPRLPGTYYGPRDPPGQEAAGGGRGAVSGAELSRRLRDLGLGGPSGGDGRWDGTPRRAGGWDHHHIYAEPGVGPHSNPPPKPRRTFRHAGDSPRPAGKGSRPPLPALPPPPLPTSPPPRTGSRRLRNRKHKAGSDRRKSFEFEDLLQSWVETGRADWAAGTRLALSRPLSRRPSQENIYEDILDPPMKENPYEDVEPEGRCLGRKCVLTLPGWPATDVPATLSAQGLSKPASFRQNSERQSFRSLDARKPSEDGTSPPSTPSSPDDTFFNLGDPQNGRKKRKIPKLVLRINAAFEARRGKKRVKRLSQSMESSSGKGTDDNSESDSDSEEKEAAHSQRLVSVKSRLRQAPHPRPLERDPTGLGERQLFEYFVVVSLHQKQAGAAYVPGLTQQFPGMLQRSLRFSREAEDQLKAVPQFCFPDAKDWAPVSQFASETFSFVLTGEDGSRRFGYCRRLLPSGKGKRLPEVYCIISRLGCFGLFSKILDEVEKRRGISPALVQPLMRSIMEAPFPALGKTVVVKSFLPGAGTEAIELRRPPDSRLDHVDFRCLFSSLGVRLLLRVFAALLLERRVIFTADNLGTLSRCCHAMLALLYPFTWQHTYIPLLPPAMLDVVCSPTPFLVGLPTAALPRLEELPVEEVLVVDLVHNRFLRQMEDEDSILPRKLQAALEHVLEQRDTLAGDLEEGSLDGGLGPSPGPLDELVSEAFVRFFVEAVGHYALFLSGGPDERTLQRDAFLKASSSRSLRRFLEVFTETQMFGAFLRERELRTPAAPGLFEVRSQEYLDSLRSGSEQGGVNKFLKGLGHRMKFLHKK
ncbi:DENN domain-containing protein 2A [Tachyglossus aculeatus]|uniref:DENN domain-containing protein 2A n=1 Tax=Tachyglossus aculeatus TaxID=9261 RepID=UPI0018F5A4CB|nr:DENN domain-containing protein 2A [Tachyglossus aculeatus]